MGARLGRSLTLREEYTEGFENRVLRRKFGPRRYEDEVTDLSDRW
jgi:hypothetical protein